MLVDSSILTLFGALLSIALGAEGRPEKGDSPPDDSSQSDLLEKSFIAIGNSSESFKNDSILHGGYSDQSSDSAFEHRRLVRVLAMGIVLPLGLVALMSTLYCVYETKVRRYQTFLQVHRPDKHGPDDWGTDEDVVFENKAYASPSLEGGIDALHLVEVPAKS